MWYTLEEIADSHNLDLKGLSRYLATHSISYNSCVNEVYNHWASKLVHDYRVHHLGVEDDRWVRVSEVFLWNNCSYGSCRDFLKRCAEEFEIRYTEVGNHPEIHAMRAEELMGAYEQRRKESFRRNRGERKQRLQKLVDVLSKIVEPAKFDMNKWYEKATEYDFDDVDDQGFAKEIDCGFAACALGWATFEKIVPELEFDFGPHNRNVAEILYTDGYRAGAAAFGINRAEAEFVFDPAEYFYSEGSSYIMLPYEDFEKSLRELQDGQARIDEYYEKMWLERRYDEEENEIHVTHDLVIARIKFVMENSNLFPESEHDHVG